MGLQGREICLVEALVEKVMFKDIKLPEPLLEFIESTKQQLLAEDGTTYVDHGVELVWTDCVSPSYTYITLYVHGSGERVWRQRCYDLEDRLDYEFLFDCVPGPFITIRCLGTQK